MAFWIYTKTGFYTILVLGNQELFLDLEHYTQIMEVY